MGKIIDKIPSFLNVREKVLFADLDGTITVTKSGKTFPKDVYDWQFKDGIIEALKKYNPTHLFIVSNQGGIEKGFVDEKEFIYKMYSIIDELAGHLPDTHIEFSFEKSNDKNNVRRKPNTGMLEEYYHDYINGYDFKKKNAMMIGDASGLKGQFSDSDYQCARNFGIRYLDVDYFIRWGNPCKYCENNGEDCKYRNNPDIVSLLPCDGDFELENWIDNFEIAHDLDKEAV